MNESKKKGVLADHHRQGKRLIPPLMRIANIAETSFRDSKIPELVWMSAIFNRATDKSAVDGIVEFLIACQEGISEDGAPHLSFLSNFSRLSEAQRQKILDCEKCQRRIPFLQQHLWHHNALFETYPLAFIFPDRPEYDHPSAIERLKLDVDALLDRYSSHATKVQTTAVFAMMATGKMLIHEGIDLPDPNAIFTSPGSDEAKRVASFVRATLNAGSDLLEEQAVSERWISEFWAKCFVLEGCK